MKYLYLVLLLLPIGAHAKTYKCVDATGQTTYQTTPCADRASQSEVRTSATAPRSTTATATATASAGGFERHWEEFRAGIPAAVQAYCAQMKPDSSDIYKNCPQTYKRDLDHMYNWAKKLYGKPNKQAVFTKYVTICQNDTRRSTLFADHWGWVATCMTNWPHVQPFKREMQAAGE